MPRSMDIVVHNDIVDVAKPGDKCLFTGTLIAVPDIISLLKVDERNEL
jgi:DNA replication licensing factor MCM6